MRAILMFLLPLILGAAGGFALTTSLSGCTQWQRADVDAIEQSYNRVVTHAERWYEGAPAPAPEVAASFKAEIAETRALFDAIRKNIEAGQGPQPPPK